MTLGVRSLLSDFRAALLPMLAPALLLVMVASLSSVAAGGAPGGRDAGLWSVAVLDFEAKDVPVELARAATDSLTTYLARTGEFRVLDSRDVRAILQEVMGEREPAKETEPAEEPDAIPVCSESSCALAAGERLAVNTVVIGSVSEFGDMLSISIRAFNVFTGEGSGEWKAESFEGREGLPETVWHLAGQVAAATISLERGGRLTPEIIEAEEAEAAVQFEAAFTLGAGFGVSGHSDTRQTCNVLDTTSVCTVSTADLKWLVNVGLHARSKDTRWAFGFRGGGTWVETTWRLDYEDPSDEYSEGSEDKGFNFYLYPLVGYMLKDTKHNSIMAFGGAGYRNFSDKSGVSSSFAALGLSLQIARLNAEIVYWRGFESESLLQNLLTVSIGFGTGF